MRAFETTFDVLVVIFFGVVVVVVASLRICFSGAGLHAPAIRAEDREDCIVSRKKIERRRLRRKE